MHLENIHSLRLTHSCTWYERNEVWDDLANASTEDQQRSEYDAVWFCRSEPLFRGGSLVQDKLKMKIVFFRNVSSYMPNHIASHARKQIVKIDTKSHNENVSISTYDY